MDGWILDGIMGGLNGWMDGWIGWTVDGFMD
jgi:hypothetical protein